MNEKPRRCRAGQVQTIMAPLKVGNTDDRSRLGTKEKAPHEAGPVVLIWRWDTF
jgi:hypothetical protein